MTGSHVYGEPGPDSDVDLVVLVSEEDARRLAALSDDGPSFRFGELNLIVCTDPKQFWAWRKGTEALAARAPVTRDEAVAEFQSRGITEYVARCSMRIEQDTNAAALFGLAIERGVA